MPEVRGRALGYAPDERGEWLVVGSDVVTEHNALLHRQVEGTWQAVPMPPSKFARPTEKGCEMPGVDPKNPANVSAIDVLAIGPDTWVVGRTARSDGRCGNAGILLRTRPVDEPLRFP
jgi:hypothetical protein